MSNLKTRLQIRDYLARIAEKHFSETTFVADANYHRRLLASAK